MPAQETAFRDQQCLYWGVTGFDRYGETQRQAVPVQLDVRWINKRALRADPQGNKIHVDATVVTDQVLDINSLVWLGIFSDWYGTGSGSGGADTVDVMEVVTMSEIPDIKARETFYEVGLQRFKGKLP